LYQQNIFGFFIKAFHHCRAKTEMSSTKKILHPVIFLTHLLGIHPFVFGSKTVRIVSQLYSFAMLSTMGAVTVWIIRDTLQANSSIVEYRNLVMELCALIFSILTLLIIFAVLYCNIFQVEHFNSLLSQLDSVVKILNCEKNYIQELSVEVHRVYIK